MTVSALLIHPDREPEVIEVEPTGPRLREVVGGWLEGVGSAVDGDWLAYADEEGRLKGLPLNRSATALARALGWPGDYLVGPVVFVGLRQSDDPEDGMVETDVPERIVSAVTG